VQFGILGRLEVSKDGHAIEVKGNKQRALLNLLLLHPNQAVSKDGIIDALWGEDLTGREAGTLRVHIAHLRKALQPTSIDRPDLIVTQHPGYLLRIDPESIDANRFERLAVEGRRLLLDDPERAEERLSEALRLWRGPALEEVAYELFAEGEARRLNELRLAATEDLFDAQLARGSHHELVGELEGLVTIHPLRERLWGQLMLALYRSGRQADALTTYRRLSDYLCHELGLEPSTQLRQLEERILLNDPTLREPGFRRGPHRRPPVERTNLIGRANQVTALQAKLRAAQLLTLTGTGGVGKTRLAQRLAWSQLEAGVEVWWVELGAMADPRLIPDQIAAAGGVAQGPDIETGELLGRLLSERELVIVLDNCEHLVDASAQLVDDLLTQAPGLKFIVTSREPLQVQGELVWRVPSLPVPEPTDEAADLITSPSVELFLERARARGITIELSALPAVATICRRLDGIPLAIELAAARITSLTPEDLSARLTDRFSLLERGGRAALARHRTLEAAIDWSFRLLSPVDQLLLSRLSVFVAGFDLEAAQAVCAFDPLTAEDVANGVERLVDKSMVEFSPDPTRRRFSFTESIQAFAWDRLPGDPVGLLSRHRDWAIGLAGAGAQGILEDEGVWYPRLTEAFGEFRAVFNESLSRGEIDAGLRLVGTLGGFLMWRHSNEALEWLERAVQAAQQSPGQVKTSTRALGLLSLGTYLFFHNRFDEGHETLEAAAALYAELGHPAGLMWTRYQQSFFPKSGDPQECVEFAQAAVDLARQIGAPPVPMAYTLTRLAEAALLVAARREIPSIEALDEILSICDEGKVYCRELPQAYATGVAKSVSGSVLAMKGSEELGFLLIDEGLAERGRFVVSTPCAAALTSAGRLSQRLGYEDRAVDYLARGLRALKDEGLPYSARSNLVGAAAAIRKQYPAVAARLLGAAASLRPSFLYGGCVFEDEESVLELVRTEAGDDCYSAEMGSGQRLGARDAIDLAISHLEELASETVTQRRVDSR
jgi:predicted ATPase/DNA-binding SARP family transcriptional activator